MPQRTALIAGSTGLIGGLLLDLLIRDEAYQKVVALTRKPLPTSADKVENIVVDFESLQQNIDQLKADDIFCCLGTTMKQAGSKEAFRKVDHEYPLQLAGLTRDQGAQKFFLVSALGAKKSSIVFYNQVKGETEESVAKLNFPTLHIFRPSLLLGPRKEKRTGEDAMKKFYQAFGFIFSGPFRKYQAIEAVKVARAMLHFAKEDQTGNFIHESEELQSY